MTASHCGVLPFARIQPAIGGTFAIRSDAEQRAEGVEWVEATIKAEGELVEIGLQMLRADRAMVCSGEPCLEVRKDKMDNWEKFFSDFGVAICGDRQVFIAERRKPIVGPPCVRNNHRARLDGLLEKGTQSLRAAIGDDFHAQPPRIAPAAPHGLVA